MSKLKTPSAVVPSEIVRCVEYMESTGGRLTQSMCRTKWPDGTVTDFSWQYAADDTGVLGAKTAMDAIRQHMKAKRRKAPNEKLSV